MNPSGTFCKNFFEQSGFWSLGKILKKMSERDKIRNSTLTKDEEATSLSK